jgi:hypothetical protein
LRYVKGQQPSNAGCYLSENVNLVPQKLFDRTIVSFSVAYSGCPGFLRSLFPLAARISLTRGIVWFLARSPSKREPTNPHHNAREVASCRSVPMETKLAMPVMFELVPGAASLNL